MLAGCCNFPSSSYDVGPFILANVVVYMEKKKKFFSLPVLTT